MLSLFVFMIVSMVYSLIRCRFCLIIIIILKSFVSYYQNLFFGILYTYNIHHQHTGSMIILSELNKYFFYILRLIWRLRRNNIKLIYNDHIISVVHSKRMRSALMLLFFVLLLRFFFVYCFKLFFSSTWIIWKNHAYILKK